MILKRGAKEGESGKREGESSKLLFVPAGSVGACTGTGGVNKGRAMALDSRAMVTSEKEVLMIDYVEMSGRMVMKQEEEKKRLGGSV